MVLKCNGCISETVTLILKLEDSLHPQAFSVLITMLYLLTIISVNICFLGFLHKKTELLTREACPYLELYVTESISIRSKAIFFFNFFFSNIKTALSSEQGC